MNILVLTSVYPELDDDEKAGVTPVVHYFTKEWVADGNNVIVIHNANKYPAILYLLPKKIIKKINSNFGIVIPEYCQRRKMYSEKDGVKVIRLPMLKVVPKGKFLNFQIKLQYKIILKYLSDAKFEPNVVIGHWENPQIQLVSMLKQKFACKSSIIFHGISYINKEYGKLWIDKYLCNIDVLGCRSEKIAKDLKKLLKVNFQTFICYSGLPNKYVAQNSKVNLLKYKNQDKHSFLYVGRIIKRKNVDAIIKALYKVYSSGEFKLDIIGEGYCETELKELVDKLNLNKKVNFLGRKNRDEIMELMRENQCFTMISRDEVFGLVYLEAMLNGCITIASKNEGFDGIIIHGRNGFLCEAGDVNGLTEIYKKINNMSMEEKCQIARQARETALKFSDSSVAKYYLNNVING